MAAQDRRLEESESRRTLIIVVAVAAGVIVASFFAFLFWASGPGEPRLQGAIRPGSPEFDQYKTQIVLDDPEAFESPRGLGDIVMSLKTTVRNLSGKTISGLEIYAAVVDHQGKPVKERTLMVIPGRQQELAPNKTMDVSVTLEGFKQADDRANIKMALAGFKFKE